MKNFLRLAISLASGGIVGAGIAFLFPVGKFWISWLSSTVLLTAAIIALYFVWKSLGKNKAVGWMIIAAYCLRLIVGLGISYVLPSWGWDEPAQKAGYLFYDAFRRDSQAWDLAQSGESILNQSREELYTDQYGGMLAISAMIYRTLSPDAHRPYLIIIFCAFFFALGIPFFYKAVHQRWDERLAKLATWCLILYPDGILYTSSQMREPILLGLSMIAFWAIMTWTNKKRWILIVLFVTMAFMAVVSSRIAIAVLLFLLAIFFLDRMDSIPVRLRKASWMFFAVLFIVMLIGSWAWLRSSAGWDMLVTETGSGWVTKVIEEIGTQFRIPFLTVYGIAQPVLPATIAEPTLPFWKVINIARASGWYLLAPLLIYAVFSLLKQKQPAERRIWAWMVLFSLFWVAISSARAGGDQWDNPRYRANMLPWLVLVASWAVKQAICHRDAWLPRWLLVEAVFLGFFTNWYFSRYFLTWKRLFFWQMIAWIVGLSALILVGGFVYDQWIKPKLLKKGNTNNDTV
jgi:hypothetical protein